jgi:tetratricopeptide (TPR) repeat protein
MRGLLVALALAVPCRAAPPASAARLNEEGIAHLGGGRPEEAVQAFEAALAARPGDPVLEKNRAAALAEWGEELRRERRTAEAAARLEQAVRAHPARVRYRVLLGRARFECGEDGLRAAARADFELALAGDPDHLDALVNLGQIAYLERGLEEAVARWRRALELRPGDADIRERLMRALRELEVERGFAELPATHFVVRYPQEIALERAQEVLALCEEARGRLSAAYQSYPPRIAVTLYTPAQFRTATDLHAWVAGLSDGTIRLTVRPRTGVEILRATIYHELTHHMVREIAPATPVWLHEGLAQMEEGKSAAAAEARLGRAAVPAAAILGAEVLRQSDPRSAALFYDVALAFTAFLHDSQRGGIARLLREIGAGRDEAAAFREAYGEPRDDLYERWRSRLPR